MNQEAYRLKQIAKLNNLEGTPELEILKVTSWLVVALLFHQTILLPLLKGRKNWCKFLIEFTFLLLPQIFIFLFPNHAIFWIVAYLVASFASLIAGFPKQKGNVVPRRLSDVKTVKRFPVLTCTRAMIMAMVSIVILAVDLDCFPIRFAKSKTFKLSLMDLGVGCVVVSMGIMAAKNYFNTRKMPSFIRIIRSTSLAFLIGIIRSVIVMIFDYHVPIDEYGKHWNFFLTLGFLPILLWVTFRFISPEVSLILGHSVAILYQVILSFTGLQNWVLNADRTSFLSLNKEGFVSLIGYYSLILISISIGRQYFNRINQRQMLNFFSLLFLFQYGGYKALEYFGIGANRKLVNLPFVLATSSLTIFEILLISSVDIILKGIHPPLIFEAISRNQLAFFLLGNTLTGLINIIWQTLLLPNWQAVPILIGYTILITGIVTILHIINVNIKL